MFKPIVLSQCNVRLTNTVAFWVSCKRKLRNAQIKLFQLFVYSNEMKLAFVSLHHKPTTQANTRIDKNYKAKKMQMSIIRFVDVTSQPAQLKAAFPERPSMIFKLSYLVSVIPNSFCVHPASKLVGKWVTFLGQNFHMHKFSKLYSAKMLLNKIVHF